MLIWIIDEEWKDYDVEKEVLEAKYPGVEIRHSTYDYEKDLKEFGYRADGILAQVYASIPKSTIDRLENCKGIAVYGGGYDRIDVAAARTKNISVTNISGYCAEDLADYVVAAMYFVNKGLAFYSRTVVEDVKAVIGGFGNLDNEILYTGTKEEIQAETKRLLAAAGRTGVILGADCTVPRDTDWKHFEWVREAAK